MRSDEAHVKDAPGVRLAALLERMREAVGATHVAVLRRSVSDDGFEVVGASSADGASPAPGTRVPPSAASERALRTGRFALDPSTEDVPRDDALLRACAADLPYATALTVDPSGQAPVALLVAAGPSALRVRPEVSFDAQLELLARSIAELDPAGAAQPSPEGTRNALVPTPARGHTESRYRRLFEWATDGIWCVEFDAPLPIERVASEGVDAFLHAARFTECNRPFAKRLGYGEDDAPLGARPTEVPNFWLTQDAERLRGLASTEFQAREVAGAEIDALGRTTRLRANVFAVREPGVVLGVWGIERDVTSEVEESQVLRESVELYGAIIRSSLDGICVLDRELRILDCNEAFAELLGASREAALLHGALTIDPRGAEGRVTFEEIAGLGSWRGEAELTRLDGSITSVELSTRYGGSGLGRFYCFVRDLTAHRLSELRDREHQEALAHVARLSTLGEMASGIAHEFNQPLAAIVNYANGCTRILEQRGEGNETVFRGLQSIVEQGKRASEIIRRLRTFSRRAEQNREPFLVSDLLTDAIDLSTKRLEREGVTLETHFPEIEEEVVADGIQIEQVLINLLFNALEALRGQPGARIRVETAALETERGAGYVQVTVSDNGPGMDAETRSRIFEPFYSGTGVGLGLGLTIGHSIVDAHGGRLWVEDDPGTLHPGFRTAFRFTLPRRSAPMPT